jgi:hypothetical protein
VQRRYFRFFEASFFLPNIPSPNFKNGSAAVEPRGGSFDLALSFRFSFSKATSSFCIAKIFDRQPKDR